VVRCWVVDGAALIPNAEVAVSTRMNAKRCSQRGRRLRCQWTADVATQFHHAPPLPCAGVHYWQFVPKMESISIAFAT
jgi:hypothetical protein